MKPEISVLLPVWNAGTTLPVCLRSIRRQTGVDWECILVDDGSSDTSLEIARSEAARDRRIEVVSRSHAGLVPTLNAGIERCRAPIIARMDADDWMHRDRLRLQTAMLRRNPNLDAVGCHPRCFPRRELRDGGRRYEAWLHSLVDAEMIWRERFIECPVAHPTLAIRRETLQEIPYRDRGWPEDYDLLLRLLRRGPCVGMIGKTLLGWRGGADRLSRKDPRYALDRFTACRAWHLHRDFLSAAPSYILWGHGPTGRALRRELETLGHRPEAIVEVHPRRIGNEIHGAQVIPPSDLIDQPPLPIIVSVAGAKPRDEIRGALRAMEFSEGDQFVFAA
ncbi:MAG: glycosyltransferase family 2 protein [Proteobacteria bacterium]|nr:glycosyltransferase family 2 protein [Pseudomonadota bacterium]